jgi:hypothetical protein
VDRLLDVLNANSRFEMAVQVAQQPFVFFI